MRGLPGGALYKAINTADSMVGHRNELTRLSAARRRGSTISSTCRRRVSPALLVVAAARVGDAVVRRGVARAAARRAPASLAECRLPGGRDRRRARPVAGRPARLWGRDDVEDAPMGERAPRCDAADIRRALALFRLADALLASWRSWPRSSAGTDHRDSARRRSRSRCTER